MRHSKHNILCGTAHEYLEKKIICAMDISMKCRKVGMEEGIMPIKSLQVGWRRDTFLTQYPMWNCSRIP